MFENLFNNESLSIKDLKSIIALVITEYNDQLDIKNSINNIYGIEQYLMFNKTSQNWLWP